MKNTLKHIASFILACLFLLPFFSVSLTPVYADSSDIQAEIDSLSSQQDELNAKLEDIQNQLNSLDNEKQRTLEKKQLLDQQIMLIQQELEVIYEQVQITDTYLANRQADLEAAIDNESYQKEQWLSRLRAMEENSSVDYIQVILEADSFSDMITRLDQVSEVLAYDESLYDQYLNAHALVEELEQEAEEMAALNEQNRLAYEAKENELNEAIDQANALIAEIQSDEAAYSAYMEEVEAAEAEVEALIAEKQVEYEEAKAEEKAAQLAAYGVSIDTSAYSIDTGDYDGFLWPSYTTTITSYFGYRSAESTNYVGSTAHEGIDIGASYGTAIWAAKSGTVTIAYYNGGYGNCVAIAHDDGTTTLYGHMSAIAVSVGEYVTQGEIIGYCGSTGNSTGPHIHFEVQIGGTAVDPLQFSYIYAG